MQKKTEGLNRVNTQSLFEKARLVSTHFRKTPCSAAHWT